MGGHSAVWLQRVDFDGGEAAGQLLAQGHVGVLGPTGKGLTGGPGDRMSEMSTGLHLDDTAAPHRHLVGPVHHKDGGHVQLPAFG